MRHFIFILIFFIFSNQLSFSSVNSFNDITDSTQVYKSIRDFAKKKKFTYTIYKAIFRDFSSDTTRHKKIKKDIDYNRYKGRIIRNIEINTYDPFGYNVRDTSIHPNSSIKKSGNYLHQKSKRITILNQLLIKRNEHLDLLKLKESERIIRKSVYVRDVTFKVVPVSGSKDSVDVVVFEQDVWSKTFGLGVTAPDYSFSFGDKNFLGLAHQLNNKLTYNNQSQAYNLSGNYSIPYIKNTYIVTTFYFNTADDKYLRGISISRPFYSTLTKWAGGLDLLKNKITEPFYDPENGPIMYSYKYNNFDTWIGRSFQLVDDTSEIARNTRLIFSLRYQKLDYRDVTYKQLLQSYNFQSSNIYLLETGISSRNYYHDYYIYRFGTPEDVPAGKLFSIVTGYDVKETTSRYYGGLKIGAGNHFDNFGYLSFMAGYGAFINKGRFEQKVLNTTVGYFSNIFSMGKWHLRQFVKTQFVYGFDRDQFESINLNGENGIRGFENSTTTGTRKILLQFQTQAYSPFSFIGFRFAPFIFVDFGAIGAENEIILKNHIYQTYGIGMIIKNELLVLNNFQFTIALYPLIPGVGKNIFKYNPVHTYDFSFNDFEISKPTLIAFQ
jgi:hemolysin activation/secretion protein